MQDMVMQTYDRFAGVVSEARHIPVEELKAGVADGRIISGQDALKHRLIDQLGYATDAWQLARTEAGVKDAEVVRYSRSPGLIESLGILGQAKSKAGFWLALAGATLGFLQFSFAVFVRLAEEEEASPKIAEGPPLWFLLLVPALPLIINAALVVAHRRNLNNPVA